MVEWIALLGLGILAGTLGGIIGFGTTVLLLPPMVYFFGPVETIPTIAVVAGMANLSRAAVWWRDIDWRLSAWYAAGAVPAVVLGARTLVEIPQRPAECILGLFLLGMIPARRWLRRHSWRPSRPHMLLVGAGIGYLTGIVATTGAINTPFFLSYGLVKGAYLGTEALSSLAVYLAKGIAFQRLGVMTPSVFVRGLLVGTSVMAGSWLARRVVLRLPETAFAVLMEGVMLLSGSMLLIMAALHG